MPYDAPAGPTIGLVGRVRARVSPSRLPGTVLASMTPDTSGRTGFGSLASTGLAASLVSRLQARASGSILWRLTWKPAPTPSGRLIWRLRASPGRISASDFSGWPTPTTPSGGQTTPQGTSATGRRPDGSKATVTLQNVAALAGCPTPTKQDAASSGAAGYSTESGRHTGTTLTDAARFAGWGSPTALSRPRSAETLEKCLAFRQGNGQTSVPLYLEEQAQMVGWATPAAHNGRKSPGRQAQARGGFSSDLPRQVELIGSSAEMIPGARLSPEHSRWLLRLPPAWDDCMVTGIALTQRRSRSS